jgi:hypothetical protein
MFGDGARRRIAEEMAMRRFAQLMVLAAALGAATLAFGQALNQTAPQPRQGPESQPRETPAPPSPLDPSMTWLQQPIAGNSNATSPPNTMAPNSDAVGRRLAAIAPSGMSAKTACEGFKTTELCAETLNVSRNLDIPFTELKAKVTGGQRLDMAIRQLRPNADATFEVRMAGRQALDDLQALQG